MYLWEKERNMSVRGSASPGRKGVIGSSSSSYGGTDSGGGGGSNDGTPIGLLLSLTRINTNPGSPVGLLLAITNA